MKKFLKNLFLYIRSYPYSEYVVYYEVRFKDNDNHEREVLLTKRSYLKHYKKFPSFSWKRRVIWKINW